MPTETTTPDQDERDLWRDAYRIAWIGASNPTAVAHAIATHLAKRTHVVGTADAGRHPAIQAMFGHLGFLLHAEHYGLGPTDDAMRTLQEKSVELGFMTQNGDYIPQ